MARKLLSPTAVEMFDELDASLIVPTFASTFRCRPLLRWLPWVGSPASQLLLRHPDFLLPALAHDGALAPRFRLPAEKTGAPRHDPASTPLWQLLTPRHRPADSLGGQLVFRSSGSEWLTERELDVKEPSKVRSGRLALQ